MLVGETLVAIDYLILWLFCKSSASSDFYEASIMSAREQSKPGIYVVEQSLITESRAMNQFDKQLALMDNL